jgi:hypothetical protein
MIAAFATDNIHSAKIGSLISSIVPDWMAFPISCRVALFRFG